AHVASFADRAYEQLSSLLRNTSKVPIPVVISGRTAHANGSFAPFPSAITIFATSPSDNFIGQKTPNWLYSVFIHELAHYLHIVSNSGIFGSLSRIFGPDMSTASTPFMGGWWIEGLSTYVESNLSEGGRGDDPFFYATYSAPVEEQSMWSLAQGAYQSHGAPRGRIYSTGYLMVDYLMDTYGTDIFADINESFLRFPFFGVRPAIKQHTGSSAKELFQQAQSRVESSLKSLDSVQQPEIFSPKESGDYHLPIATDSGLLGLANTISFGVAVLRYEDAQHYEVVKRLSTTDSLSFDTTGDGNTWVITLAWTDRFDTANTGRGEVSYSDLYLYDARHDTFRQITQKERLYQPTISTDGSSIVAMQRIGVRYRLVSVEPNDGTIRVVYEAPNGSLYHPRYAPDDSLVAAIEIIEGLSTIVLIDTDGVVTRLWPNAKLTVSRPRFLDQKTLTFGSDISGTMAVYQYDLSSKELRLVVEDRIGAFGAVRYEDRWLYSSYTSNGYTLKTQPFTEGSVVSLDEFSSTPTQVSESYSFINEAIIEQPYQDIPRMGVWLPYPLYETSASFAPGAIILLRSALGRHSIVAAGNWSIQDNLPMFEAQYSYFNGRSTIETNIVINNLLTTYTYPFFIRTHSVNITLETPLAANARPDYSTTFESAVSFNFEVAGEAMAASNSLQLLWAAGEYRASKALYGRSRIMAATALHTIWRIHENSWELQPALRFAGQVALGNSGHILALEVDGIMTSETTLGPNALLPRSAPPEWPSKPGKAKLLGTVTWAFPVALLDIPIPFGGLTSLGSAWFAQSAAYWTQNGVDWEHDVYLGGELTATMQFMSLTARPNIGVITRVSDWDWRIFIHIGLPIDLIIGKQDKAFDLIKYPPKASLH
ncbi:MAG: hypothetical protein PHH86_05600, partial [Sphaerochaetaceae bacterium]|nr:hypothetical protein [Sphaerochaetaceae bacterium]